MSEKKNRVAIYARVSTDNKRQDYNRQVELGKREIERRPDWTLYKIYSDEESAFKEERYFHRTRFHEMLQDAKAQRFDVLWVEAQDRFSRLNPLIAMSDLQRLIYDYGIRYIAHDEHVDTSEDLEEWMFMLLSQMYHAFRFSRKLSRRVKQGIDRAYRGENGEWRKPWGQAVTAKKLRKKQKEIVALRKRGYSIRDIAEEVTYYTKKGTKKNVSPAYVHKTLKEAGLTGND
jgi:DNA invertase Pin-like site-specific DNA recombinase